MAMVFLLIRPTWSYSIFLLFTFFTTQVLLCGADDGEYYTDCSRNFTCGNINVPYPFWGNGIPEYCGHEGFELKCQEQDGFPRTIIEVKSERYLVLNINESSTIITFARLGQRVNPCLRAAEPFNTVINRAMFDYAPGVSNLTIFYNCIDPYLIEPMNNMFQCPDDDSIVFFVNDSISEEALQPYITHCSLSIKVPVVQRTLEALTNGSISLQQALEDGFGVEYKIDQHCPACRSSGGFCGTNRNSPAFVCYCQDKPYPDRCPHRRSQRALRQKALIEDLLGKFEETDRAFIMLYTVESSIFFFFFGTIALYTITKAKWHAGFKSF